MNEQIIDGNWIVQDLMEQYPLVLPVFKELKLGCLGCSMANFCTLQEVAVDYKLNLESFLLELRRAVAQSNLNNPKGLSE